jgi:hypothetical protein
MTSLARLVDRTDQTVSRGDRFRASIACPSCKHRDMAALRLTAETSRRAAKRPATPELVDVCPHCAAVLVLALLPSATQREDGR